MVITAFQLNGKLSIQPNEEKGYLAFGKESGRPFIVFSSLALHHGGKIMLPSLNWDAPSSVLSVALAGVQYPFSLAFGITTEIPKPDKLGFNFGFNFGFASKEKSGKNQEYTAEGTVEKHHKSKVSIACSHNKASINLLFL